MHVCAMNELRGGGQEADKLSLAGRNGQLVTAFEEKVGVDLWAGRWWGRGELGKRVSRKQIQGSTWELIICQGETSIEGEGRFV